MKKGKLGIQSYAGAVLFIVAILGLVFQYHQLQLQKEMHRKVMGDPNANG